MTANEIREIAIDSATAYYQYLDVNEKGVQEVDVFEITNLNDNELMLKLRISSKLFDTEAIFFKNLKNGNKYSTSQVKILEYDNDKNVLLIKPTKEVESEFRGIENRDIKVISDLKFLVQRVKTWYERNGYKLVLPKIASEYSSECDKITYFSEQELHPSVNQITSIKNIFCNPFSYIWGAPGTGKTQFVLSYAVLHYIYHGKRVAILAPTNNSLEQVLRGVLKMTDKALIDRSKILRLGTPSKIFAEMFPEVCEERGVQKKIDEIDKQINIINRILSFENNTKMLNHIYEGMKILTKYPDLLLRSEESINLYENKLKKYNKVGLDLEKINLDITNLKNENLIHIAESHSLKNKVIKLFSLKQTKNEKQIEENNKAILNKEHLIELLNERYSQLTRSVTELNIIKTKEEVKLFKYTNKLKTTFSISPELEIIINKLNKNNYQTIKSDIENSIHEIKNRLEIDKYMVDDYKSNFINLTDELNNYRLVRENLSTYSTDERLKSVQVIACTLDGYIGRFTDSKLEVDHIFLDEAGYANIIKVLTLFCHTVPISFLGDHMQLPPVCEINDLEIKNNEQYRNMFLWAQAAIFIDDLFFYDRDKSLNQYLNNSKYVPKYISTTTLSTTFRFGYNLANILGKHVYDRNFRSSSPVGQTHILYINAQRTEGAKPRTSITEVQAIKSLITNLKLNNRHDFVILTPYKSQLKLLNINLPEERNNLKILTVHGSQGREWETVILSVVDTFDKWFVDSLNTNSKGLKVVNTAVSRTKKQLIIVCDLYYWLRLDGQLLTDLLREGKEIKQS